MMLIQEERQLQGNKEANSSGFFTVSPSCTYHLSLSTTCTRIQPLICIKTHNKSDTIYNYGQQKNSGIEYNVMCCKCKIQVGYTLKYNVGIWEILV